LKFSDIEVVFLSLIHLAPAPSRLIFNRFAHLGRHCSLKMGLNGEQQKEEQIFVAFQTILGFQAAMSATPFQYDFSRFPV